MAVDHVRDDPDLRHPVFVACGGAVRARAALPRDPAPSSSSTVPASAAVPLWLANASPTNLVAVRLMGAGPYRGALGLCVRVFSDGSACVELGGKKHKQRLVTVPLESLKEELPKKLAR